MSEVTTTIGGREVLSDVHLTVPSGQFLMLVGPAGSGKTTLARTIAGLHPLTKGRIFLNGADISALPPQYRRLGIVSQRPALFTEMTVRENLAFPLLVRGVPKREVGQRVEETAQVFGISDDLDRRAGELSEGQKQKNALARAVVWRPDGLVLDEPFALLDAVNRAEMRRTLRRVLTGYNVPVLFVTNDPDEALEMGDTVAILRKGRIVQVGNPYEVYTHPQDEGIASFLGIVNVLFGVWQSFSVFVVGIELAADDVGLTFEDRQPVRVVFRPEDAILSYEAQFLNTRQVLGAAIVEGTCEFGASQRVTVRLAESPRSAAHTRLVRVTSDSRHGLPIIVSRPRWEANEMPVEAGDQVIVGLRQFRLLPHFGTGQIR